MDMNTFYKVLAVIVVVAMLKNNHKMFLNHLKEQELSSAVGFIAAIIMLGIDITALWYLGLRI